MLRGPPEPRDTPERKKSHPQHPHLATIKQPSVNTENEWKLKRDTRILSKIFINKEELHNTADKTGVTQALTPS